MCIEAIPARIEGVVRGTGTIFIITVNPDTIEKINEIFRTAIAYHGFAVFIGKALRKLMETMHRRC